MMKVTIVVIACLFVSVQESKAWDIVTTARAYIGTNPTGWDSRWCGLFMRMVVRQAGHRDPGDRFNVAANWKRLGRPASAKPGAFVVWPHHIGIVVRMTSAGRAIVISGNTGPRGNRRVLEEERSIEGATFRYL